MLAILAAIVLVYGAVAARLERTDGQKVVLAIKNMGGESEAAWRAVLDDLTSRGLARP